MGNDQVGVDLMGTNPRSVSFAHRRLNVLGKYLYFMIYSSFITQLRTSHLIFHITENSIVEVRATQCQTYQLYIILQ